MFMSLKEDFLEGGGCAENCFHFRFGQFFCFWTIFLLLDNFFALDNCQSRRIGHKEGADILNWL